MPGTRTALTSLMRRTRAGGNGQTIIWHGPTGTGKTSALRALAWEWRRWSSAIVVTDPDRLFSADSGYLMELLTATPVRSGSRGHRLLVLEDAGELLSRNARHLVGHGLSRFLNACDGLLGDAAGATTMLVKPNEPVKALHPAIRRPGRCLAQIEFGLFTVRQANAWLAKRCSDRVTQPTSLATLFAVASGTTPLDFSDSSGPTVGFGSDPALGK